jgi:hypothetical protein
VAKCLKLRPRSVDGLESVEALLQCNTDTAHRRSRCRRTSADTQFDTRADTPTDNRPNLSAKPFTQPRLDLPRSPISALRDTLLEFLADLLTRTTHRIGDVRAELLTRIRAHIGHRRKLLIDLRRNSP